MSTRQIVRQTTGEPGSFFQAFISNQYVLTTYPNIPPFVYDVPLFGVTGGTTQYYAQDPSSIFTSLSIPFIRYEFTGNTHSLSGDTVIIHDVYKIRYSTFKEYSLDFNVEPAAVQDDTSTLTETETVTDENGFSTTKTIVKNSVLNKSTISSTQMGNSSIDEIVFEFSTPITSFSAATSGLTSLIYDFTPNQLVKATGSTDQLLPTEKLFDDRGQYFIKTHFRFSKDTIKGYTDEMEKDKSSGKSIIVTASTPSPEHLFTDVEPHIITATTFSGYSVAGSFFSYFDVAGKPKFEQPYVDGTLDTFSPTFYFSNVLDGDEYKLDVTYNISDTGFTGDFLTAAIEKNLVDGVQQFSYALKNDSDFAYRVGNVKTLTNIFGVKQSVVTYSDTLTARTQSEPVSIYVFSSSDSPYITDLPVLSTPPNININPEVFYSLSGLVSGSIVTGATIALTYPGGFVNVQPTNIDGTYLFTGLTPGNYVMETAYRGYKTSSRNVSIGGDTADSYKIQLLWSNNVDTWGKMANDNFFI